MKKPQHIAFAPARKGSVGFPGKNRLFFDFTADFLGSCNIFDQVIISTDDEVIKEKSQKRNFTIHHRNAFFSGPAISLKQVAENMIEEMNIASYDYVWLIFVNVLYRNIGDFQKTKELVEKEGIMSLCSFVKAMAHPYDCWIIDENEKKLKQYIKNDFFRRQDKPKAWQHYHYLTCFKAKILPLLNHELIYEHTYPLFLGSTGGD